MILINLSKLFTRNRDNKNVLCEKITAKEAQRLIVGTCEPWIDEPSTGSWHVEEQEVF